jgi:enhancing lycopene biosynthesis protein 2
MWKFGIGKRRSGMKRIGVLLSGSGHRDGTEIHEAVCTLLAIDKGGARAIGIAPNIRQSRVVNHLTQLEEPAERNVMIEAARIMRGNVLDISKVTADDLDALIIPGGFGAALNLSNYAKAGPRCEVEQETKRLILECVNKRRPIGAICIAPVVVAKALEGSGRKPLLTIGDDEGVKGDIEAMGARHKECSATEVVVDAENKIVTTPAYMLAKRISEVEEGISRLVSEVIRLCQ